MNEQYKTTIYKLPIIINLLNQQHLEPGCETHHIKHHKAISTTEGELQSHIKNYRFGYYFSFYKELFYLFIFILA